MLLYTSIEKYWKQTQHTYNSKYLKIQGQKHSYGVTWKGGDGNY